MANKYFTFLAVNQARLGYVFIYEGIAEECVSCSYLKVCHGKLKEGVAYKVVEVKDRKVECPLLGEVLLVRVEPVEVEAALEVKHAIEGAIVSFAPRDCSQLECQYFDLCVPTFSRNGGGTYKIVRVGEAFTCPLSGIRLVQVWLLPREV